MREINNSTQTSNQSTSSVEISDIQKQLDTLKGELAMVRQRLKNTEDLILIDCGQQLKEEFMTIYSKSRHEGLWFNGDSKKKIDIIIDSYLPSIARVAQHSDAGIKPIEKRRMEALCGVVNSLNGIQLNVPGRNGNDLERCRSKFKFYILKRLAGKIKSIKNAAVKFFIYKEYMYVFELMFPEKDLEKAVVPLVESFPPEVIIYIGSTMIVNKKEKGLHMMKCIVDSKNIIKSQEVIKRINQLVIKIISTYRLPENLSNQSLNGFVKILKKWFHARMIGGEKISFYAYYKRLSSSVNKSSASLKTGVSTVVPQPVRSAGSLKRKASVDNHRLEIPVDIRTTFQQIHTEVEATPTKKENFKVSFKDVKTASKVFTWLHKNVNGQILYSLFPAEDYFLMSRRYFDSVDGYLFCDDQKPANTRSEVMTWAENVNQKHAQVVTIDLTASVDIKPEVKKQKTDSGTSFNLCL
jgi:hypothetical protein